MGWDVKRRGSKRGYFYRSVRIPEGGVRKVYFGRRAAGQEMAAVVEANKQARATAREEVRAERLAMTEADALGRELMAWAQYAVTCRLVASGHRNHRGQWRKPHMSTKRKPRVGSKAWDEELHKDKGFVKNTMIDLSKRACAGDREATETLAGWLETHPDMKPVVFWLGDLQHRVELYWVLKMSDGNTLLEKELRDEISRMRAELLPPNAGVVERIVVDNLITCHIANQHANLLASVKSKSIPVTKIILRRVESTQKRLSSAIKMLGLIESKRVTKSRPVKPLKVFDEAA